MSRDVTEGLGRVYAATALFIAVGASWLVLAIAGAAGHDDGVALESQSGDSSHPALTR